MGVKENHRRRIVDGGDAGYSTSVVCAWLGNTPTVAHKHYLTVTDEHFKAAANTGEKLGMQTPVLSRGDSQKKTRIVRNVRGNASFSEVVAILEDRRVAAESLNPTFASLVLGRVPQIDRVPSATGQPMTIPSTSVETNHQTIKPPQLEQPQRRDRGVGLDDRTDVALQFWHWAEEHACRQQTNGDNTVRYYVAAVTALAGWLATNPITPEAGAVLIFVLGLFGTGHVTYYHLRALRLHRRARELAHELAEKAQLPASLRLYRTQEEKFHLFHSGQAVTAAFFNGTIVLALSLAYTGMFIWRVLDLK